MDHGRSSTPFGMEVQAIPPAITTFAFGFNFSMYDARSLTVAFETALKPLAPWNVVPSEATSDGFLLQLETWNDAHSVRLDVSVYAAEPDEVVGVPFGITVALYDRDRDFMFDTGFGLSYSSEAIAFIQKILDESYVVTVSETRGSWSGSAAGPPAPTGDDREASYIRSWKTTYDRG